LPWTEASMTLARFLSDRRGNVATIFGLALIPVVGLVGAAVDYSRANSTRTDMQAAIDATALMLSRTAPTMTSTQLQQSANDFFLALFNRPETRNLQIAAVYDGANSSVTVSVTGSVPTNFMGLLGINSIDLATSGTVTWGNSRLRVALVLDNTG